MTIDDPDAIPEDLERILYVDDEPDIRAIAKVALEVVGEFEVLFCASGREAIDQAAEFRT